jgi:MmyB-like transcription regulator ligand binding domain
MTTYPIHTIASAPETSKLRSNSCSRRSVFLPNLAAAIANSPKLVTALVGVFQQVHGSRLTEQEIQIVLLTDAVANSSAYAVAFHTALVLDRHWNVIRTNDAAPRFLGSFVDLEVRPQPRNLLDLMFDPAGMRPFVEEWEKVAAGLLQRVRREAVGQVLDTELQKLLERLRKYPGVTELKPPLAPQSPVLPITFRRGDQRFSYFSLITTVGTPQCITAQELRVECMFPIDA